MKKEGLHASHAPKQWGWGDGKLLLSARGKWSQAHLSLSQQRGEKQRGDGSQAIGLNQSLLARKPSNCLKEKMGDRASHGSRGKWS